MNLQVEQSEKTPHIQINELYGPTLQGEGIDIGRPCMFLRLHHCPVHCPGCDSSVTWDGSESGERVAIDSILTTLKNQLTTWPGCGVVLTGGEPLIHYKNAAFKRMLTELAITTPTPTFLSLETSGFVGMNFDKQALLDFIHLFDTVHLSPKITPCLHGIQSDEHALATQLAFGVCSMMKSKLVYKFVARDQADVDTVLKWDAVYHWRKMGYPVYLMPYGIHRDEILATCERLLPACAKHGFVLSPRLHSILWGPKRGT